MAGIPAHTVENAPAAARPLPAEMVQFSPTGQLVRTALMLAAAAADVSRSALVITSMSALRSGWRQDQVEALLAGRDRGEDKFDALAGVVREAAANSGRVTGTTRAFAADRGYGDEQLAEAFAYLGLTVFASCFLNYAATDLGIRGSGPSR
jgi:hypothetical protein